jgi:hypothetical protein
VIAGRLSSEDREPPLVLVNAKWPLVEPIRTLRRAKLIPSHQMVRHIRRHRRTHEGACTCKMAPFFSRSRRRISVPSLGSCHERDCYTPTALHLLTEVGAQCQ